MRSRTIRAVIWAAVLLALGLGAQMACASQAEVFQNYQQGVELARQGKFAESKEAFARALKLDPANRPSMQCLRTVNDVLEKRIKPETGRHIFQGVVHLNQGDLEGAIREYTRAIELDPKYAVVYNDRGEAYLRANQYDLGIADLTRALELDPKYPEAYMHRGIGYELKGDFDRAITDYNKALEINPKYYMAWFNKADACEKAGRKKEAIEAYRNFLKYAPPRDERQIQRAKERLRVLEGTPGQ